MKRSPRAKVITAVMLAIVTICLVFLALIYGESERSMERTINSKSKTASIVAESIIEQIGIQYQLRIKTFINYKASETRRLMIEAFARRDREELQKRSKPFLEVLQKENPYFSTLGWILPDNHAFLRVHSPDNFGQDVTQMRPDVAAVNATHKQQSGFTTGYVGLQYRVVEPVFYEGKYLGAVQIGIDGRILQHTVLKKLHAPAGVAIDNSQYDTILKQHRRGQVGTTHTIETTDSDLFRSIGHLDWQRKQYQVMLNNKPYELCVVHTLTNYRKEKVGLLFVALDISQELNERQSLIVSAILLSAMLIALSFVILYFSYGNLIQKIVDLNFSLERNNKELEDRVEKRTRELLNEIEERKHAEEKLQKAEKMEAIGLMAGGVAHDLNNILSGIVSYPELILMQIDEGDRLYSPVKAIHESGLRAAAVVSDLLTVARSAANVRENANVNTLVKEYLASPEAEKLYTLYPCITIRDNLAPDLYHINCSPVHIKKCLMNLVLNAAEAMDGSGVIEVRTKKRTQDSLEGEGDESFSKEAIALIVRDNGPGIAKEDLEHVVEPFYTKKKMGRSGTGIGLTVVWNTVQDHGGRIQVESDAGGTCFTLLFPATRERIDGSPKDKISTADLQGKGEHILVVDDEPHQRDIASQLLTLLGYRVDTVRSGEEAIAFLHEQKVDLLLLDMLMDPGINGRQTYEAAIQIHPRLKAVIASGFSDSDDVKETTRLGADALISKPYTLEQLGLAVLQALRQPDKPE